MSYLKYDNTVYAEISPETKSQQENEYEVPKKLASEKPNNPLARASAVNKCTIALTLAVVVLMLMIVAACIGFGQEIVKQKTEVSEMASHVQALSERIDEASTQMLSHTQALSDKLEKVNLHLQQLNESIHTGSMFNPTSSCASLPLNSPSGYYWVRASNGSAVRVYCDMTRSCGGVTGGWIRVAELDMTNSSHQCPSGFRQRFDSDLHTCVANSSVSGCFSATFLTFTLNYSRVCGRIIAYQYGSPDAFEATSSIDSAYVDGISLTHGRPRKHIWTFAAAIDEVISAGTASSCPCIQNYQFAVDIPSFVGSNYFCDTGSRDAYQQVLYTADPLWDGAGCGRQNTCCSFNNPPWFYRELPQPTTDDIEMRVCRAAGSSNEDIAIETVDLYVR